ncbi:hypothetical protein AVEN_33488-1 [Araneus ventricosus]|uniref:Retrovirus-related Pol polyprotein from transposon TNT 1-94-like beta-barrel domain-containing protein n=1 Tax=Araneus ventricosus TaxID=182803 RepID=A0A4Y2GWK7_ARAVE|nr:hypothetical protein AVEN_33488-1 [Araneus ventricosus]
MLVHLVNKRLIRNILNPEEPCWTRQENLVNTRKIVTLKEWGRFCEFCSRKGHIASHCCKKRNKEKQAFVSETWFCGINQSVGAFGVWKDLEQLLIDSAATSNFCCERDWFKNFKELSTTFELLPDNKYTCEVKGVGDIDFLIKDIRGNVQITLKEVFYASDMRRNFISGAKMDIAGFKIS